MTSDPAQTPILDPDPPSEPGLPRIGLFGLPEMQFPNEYVWFVFFSSLDVMLTWAILARNGTEVNPLARLVIDMWDLPGAIAFKFSLTLFVIIACEVVARSRASLGLRLAQISIGVSAMPVMYSLLLLLVHTYYVAP